MDINEIKKEAQDRLDESSKAIIIFSNDKEKFGIRCFNWSVYELLGVLESAKFEFLKNIKITDFNQGSIDEDINFLFDGEAKE